MTTSELNTEDSTGLVASAPTVPKAEGASWSLPDASLHAGTATDSFSGPVAVCGTTAVVGANAGSSGTGAAYIFQFTGSEWKQTARLVASDGAQGDCFGCAVDIDGSTVVVGAYDCTVGANARQGAAYVFTLGDSGWTQQQKLTASDGAAKDWFAYSVAVSRDTIVIGANKCQVG